jgi:energy-converting hydrogenase Eha subunit B
MLLEKLIRKLPCRSGFVRALIGGTVTGVVVTVAVVVVSGLLGLPAPPGVAGTLGAVSGCAYVAAHR